MSDTTYDGDDLCPECGGEGFTLEGDTHVATACPRCDGGGTIATHADPTGMAVETRCWTTWEGHRCVLDKDHDGDHDYTEPEPDPRCDAWSIGGDERCLLTVGHTDPHFYATDLPSGETTTTHPPGWYGVTISDPGTGDVWSGLADPDDDLAAISDVASSAARAHPTGAMPSAPIIGPHPPEVDRVAAAARAWYDAPERRRAYLRAYSEAVVNLRACFTVLAEGPSQGDPDWRGRSGDYRDSIAEARHRSGLSDDAWRILTGGARYHVGAMVRKRATPEQLEHADLSPLTPNERGRTR